MDKKRSLAEYRLALTKLLNDALGTRFVGKTITFKNCFGAVAGYVEDKIFVSCGQFGLALKLPPDTLRTLFEDEDVKPLQYFPNGHVKKDYAVLPERVLSNREALRRLLKESIDHGDGPAC